MKIVWIDLNCSYAHSSLALPALHAQIKHRQDIEWAVVRSTTADVIGNTVSKIYEQRPNIVCATAWLFTHEHLLHILKRLKALLPEVIVFLGGPEFLGNNEDYLRSHLEVNLVLRGEGEHSFATWLEVYNQPEKWTIIPGLCYINNGLYRDNGIARAMDFSKIAIPEESEWFSWDKPFVQIETTRGCFNSCAFCVSGIGDPIRKQPISTIRHRLQQIANRGMKDVRILDRTFNYNAQHAINLLELFQEFHPQLRFHLEIHPALLTSKLKEALANMPNGMLHLEAGIQSLRAEVLEISERKGALESAMEGLRYLCSLPNIVVHADLIAGLPRYTLTQIYEDIKNLAFINAGEIQLESLKLLPGTKMRNNAENLGIKYSPAPPYEVLETREISCNELQEARLLSRLLDGYYNTNAWIDVTRFMILNEEDFLRNFLEFLTHHHYIEYPMSLERRGELLYQFCKENYPQHTDRISMAWIDAGMSMKKQPAEKILSVRKHQLQSDWEVIYGTYTEGLRLFYLPQGDESYGILYGYLQTGQHKPPIFKALSKNPTIKS